MKGKQPNRYEALVERCFFRSFRPGDREVLFTREELISTAAELRIEVPKNLGDVVYSFRYRYALPKAILDTQPDGMEWIIEGKGKALYGFSLVPVNRIEPNPNLATIKIPDATPQIVVANSMSDEQALLAKVRYNRLIDTFLGITATSLQNHLRTTVKGLGQIEIDEIYVGVDRHGCQYVVPVQAKGGNDRLSTVQTKQDLACCLEKFSALECRLVSAQFMDDDRIAMFELSIDEAGFVRISEERHYLLKKSEDISAVDLATYRRMSSSQER